jgi:hypothetical protein
MYFLELTARFSNRQRARQRKDCRRSNAFTIMKKNSSQWIMAALVLACVVGAGCRKNNGNSAGESKVTGSPSDAPVLLAQKWTPGQRYIMRMESIESMQLPNFFPGRGAQPGATNSPVENNFAQEYSLTVTNSTDGQRDMEMEILAIELMAGQGNQQINYDSRNKVVREGGPVADVFDRLIGGKIYYLLSADNKVLKVEGIKDLFARVEAPADNPANAGGRRGGARGASAMLRNMYNEDMFKQMLELAGAPPRAMRVGESWSNTRDVTTPTVGKLVVTTTNTLRGWQEHDGKKCARVEFIGAMASADEGTSGGAMPVRTSLKSGSLSGRYWFAPELGISVETSIDQTYVISMSGQFGRPPGKDAENANANSNFSVPVRQNVSVKLLEVKPISE